MLSLRAIAMTIIGLTGCGISLRKPYWGLLLLVFLYFFRPDMWGAEQYVRPVQWLTVAVTIGWLRTRQSGAHSSAPAAWLLGLLGLYVLSSLLAPYSGEPTWTALEQLAKIFVVVYLITQLCDTPQRLSGLMTAMLLGMLYFVRVMVLSWAAVGFSGEARVSQLIGQGGGSNYVAWLLAATAPMLAYMVLRGRGRYRIVSLVLLGPWLASIVATGSRGGYLCLAAGLATLLIVVHQFRLALLLTVMAAAFLWAAPHESIERAATLTTDPKEMDDSLLSRYQNVQIGLKLIADHPVFGTALGSFPKAKLRYQPIDYAGREFHVAHNTLIQMGSEAGLPLLAVFVAMNLAVLRGLLRRPWPLFAPQAAQKMEWVRVGLLSALAATVIQMLKADAAQFDFFWWLYGAGMAYGMICRKARPMGLHVAATVSKVPTPPRPGRPIARGTG